MARTKRQAPDFKGMSPDEGARHFLKYVWEMEEENAERLDRLERYFAHLYEMVYAIHSRSGASGFPRATLPPEVAEVAREGTRVAAKKIAEFLKKSGFLR